MKIEWEHDYQLNCLKPLRRTDFGFNYQSLYPPSLVRIYREISSLSRSKPTQLVPSMMQWATCIFWRPNSLFKDCERPRTPCFPAANAAKFGLPRQPDVADLYMCHPRLFNIIRIRYSRKDKELRWWRQEGEGKVTTNVKIKQPRYPNSLISYSRKARIAHRENANAPCTFVFNDASAIVNENEHISQSMVSLNSATRWSLKTDQYPLESTRGKVSPPGVRY